MNGNKKINSEHKCSWNCLQSSMVMRKEKKNESKIIMVGFIFHLLWKCWCVTASNKFEIHWRNHYSLYRSIRRCIISTKSDFALTWWWWWWWAQCSYVYTFIFFFIVPIICIYSENNSFEANIITYCIISKFLIIIAKVKRHHYI